VGPGASQAQAVPWNDTDVAPARSCKDLLGRPEAPSAFRFSQALAAAERAIMRGRLDLAHQAYCEASLISEPVPAVLTGLAQVRLIQGDLSGALEATKELLKLDPESATALNLLGDVSIRMGKVSEAKAAWTSAAGATKLSSTLAANLLRASVRDAKRAMHGSDLGRADRMLRRALALDPRNVETVAKLALVLQRNGNPKAAGLWISYAESLEADHAQLERVKANLDATMTSSD
jgi:cytochrome c-type biogenesis protein CcmH/NrfG